MSSYFELGMDKKLIVPYADYLKAMKPDYEYVGDKKEILDVVKTLNLPTANSVKIVSQRGAGATALLDALAHYQHESYMPDDFMIRPLFKFNGNNLFNTSDNKAIETRFTTALEEMKQYYEQRLIKPVLLIDDGCNFILNAPQHVINNLIEATVEADYLDVVINVDAKKEDDFNAKHPEFANSFTTKELKEPDFEQIVSILKSRAKIFEAKGIKIEEDTLRYLVNITQRFKAMYDTAQPNRSVRLLDSAATGFHMEVHSKPPGAWEKERQLKEIELQAKADGVTQEQADSLNSQAATLRIELEKGVADWKVFRAGIEAKKKEIRDFEIMAASAQKIADDLDRETRKINGDMARNELAKLEENDAMFKGKRKAEVLKLDEQTLLDFVEFDMAVSRNPKAVEQERKIATCNEAILKKHEELNKLGDSQRDVVVMPPSEIEKVATVEAKTPVSGVSGVLKENLRNGMTLMKESVYGQDHVLEPIVASLRRAAAGLNDPDRPLGNFIIAGPPGTGKTWIGKQIAVKLFGSEEYCEVLDMEKYQKDHTVSALLGAPPGYAGYGKLGKLIEIGQRKPFCVLVLDEIEKAHPDIRQALLKVKGSGRLVGFDGEEADFRNIIIVETTNYGQAIWANNDYATGVKLFNEQIHTDTATFSPEYLDRADALLCAGPLDADALLKIVDREVGKLRKKVAKREVEIDAPIEDLRAFVEAKCLKVSGRQSEMMINKIIGDPLADLLLTEGPTKGKLSARFNNQSKAFTTEFLRASVANTNAPTPPKPAVA